MILRRLALFFAMLFGLAATQAPEFEQQYRQRLGGAIDELKAIVAQFDTDSATDGMSLDAGIAHLQASADPFVQGRGDQMQAIVGRFHKLTRESEDFDTASAAGRLVRLTTEFDPRIARRAYQSYQPAVPVTAEGFITGVIGFILGGVLVHAIGWPVRRLARHRHLRLTQKNAAASV